MAFPDNAQLPLARTYHASCLVQNYMVVIGGEASADLKDFWALDLDNNTWRKPEVQYFEHYTAKRFHTATAINDHKVVTFGGCHSEYVHLNELHVFDMRSFMENPADPNVLVYCTKVNVTENIPSTRWGHSAAAYNEKLYILGGRNDQDIIDLHEFDYPQMKWRQIEVAGQQPKPRRRHSAIFVSGSMVMFGGFDGNFFNDMHILDFQKPLKQIINILPSTID